MPELPANEPKVIYENENFLAIDKPVGLMVHAAKIAPGRVRTVEKRETLVDWLMARYPALKNVGDEPTLRPGIVHRLDKETSGIMLIAKTQPYFQYLKGLFQDHEVKKIYYAVVKGILKKTEGIIDVPIGIRNGTLKRSIHATQMRKEAITEYRVIQEMNASSLLEIHPKTGRTHQIRVHLASIGHPIVGDSLYGKKSKHRLMLHAAVIEFREKNGSTIRLEAETPKEFMR